MEITKMVLNLNKADQNNTMDLLIREYSFEKSWQYNEMGCHMNFMDDKGNGFHAVSFNRQPHIVKFCLGYYRLKQA